MPESSDWLEQGLREAEPYIENDGFSRKVIQALPARRRRSRITRRKGIVLSAGILGCALSWGLLSGSLGQPFVQLLSSQWAVTILSMLALAVVAVTSWWLLAVRE